MIKAKKSLGQNFLKDDAVLHRIVENANLSVDDVVIEIGPGHGVLTELLAQKCKKVIATELDNRLIETLQNKFRSTNNVEIIHGDILKINLPNLVKNYKVVANLPYYITSPVIRLFLETQYPPQEMILMVQKEVAERICASPSEIPTKGRGAERISQGKAGKMSILAVSVQYYAKPEYLFTVPKESFEPMPKVESAVLKISSISSSHFQGEDVRITDEVKKFFRIVRAGFSAKRKTLVNNLSNGLSIDKKEIEEKLISLRFSKNTRAQELGVEDWNKLVKML
jgi:16S rRNA (adenine1518-N6/adenine1519-N6)-dimethyltransferase